MTFSDDETHALLLLHVATVEQARQLLSSAAEHNTDMTASANYNWVLFAQIAAAAAARAPDIPKALVWGELALRAYAVVKLNNPSPSGAFSSDLSGLNLRARLIGRFGAQPDNPLLALDVFEQFAIRSLGAPLAEAKGLLQTIKRRPLNPHELLKLRRIKNVLGPIQLLADSQMLSPDSPLQEWLLLAGDLP